MKDDSKTLEEQLGDEDWAIIIGKDGNLKGLFMPDGSDEDIVPESIIYIMENYFGMDFNSAMDDEKSDGKTVH